MKMPVLLNSVGQQRQIGNKLELPLLRRAIDPNAIHAELCRSNSHAASEYRSKLVKLRRHRHRPPNDYALPLDFFVITRQAGLQELCGIDLWRPDVDRR